VSWPSQGGKQEARGKRPEQFPETSIGFSTTREGKNSMLPYLQIFTF